MTKQKKAVKVQSWVDSNEDNEAEDLIESRDTLYWKLTDVKREVRLSDESDYFNND